MTARARRRARGEGHELRTIRWIGASVRASGHAARGRARRGHDFACRGGWDWRRTRCARVPAGRDEMFRRRRPALLLRSLQETWQAPPLRRRAKRLRLHQRPSDRHLRGEPCAMSAKTDRTVHRRRKIPAIVLRRRTLHPLRERRRLRGRRSLHQGLRRLLGPRGNGLRRASGLIGPCSFQCGGGAWTHRESTRSLASSEPPIRGVARCASWPAPRSSSAPGARPRGSPLAGAAIAKAIPARTQSGVAPASATRSSTAGRAAPAWGSFAARNSLAAADCPASTTLAAVVISVRPSAPPMTSAASAIAAPMALVYPTGAAVAFTTSTASPASPSTIARTPASTASAPSEPMDAHRDVRMASVRVVIRGGPWISSTKANAVASRPDLGRAASGARAPRRQPRSAVDRTTPARPSVDAMVSNTNRRRLRRLRRSLQMLRGRRRDVHRACG